MALRKPYTSQKVLNHLSLFTKGLSWSHESLKLLYLQFFDLTRDVISISHEGGNLLTGPYILGGTVVLFN